MIEYCKVMKKNQAKMTFVLKKRLPLQTINYYIRKNSIK